MSKYLSSTLTPVGITGVNGLKTTGIKTSAYTASSFELVRCNTANGAFSVTLPSSPADGDVIAFLDTANTFRTNNLTILPNGKTIEGDTSAILDVNGAYIQLILVGSNWKFEFCPIPLSQTGGSNGKLFYMRGG